MRPCVFVPQPIHSDALHFLRRKARVVVGFGPDATAWTDGLACADGIVLRTAPFRKGDFELAARLKVIARHGVGVDNVDLEEATRRGVAVVNTPLANVESVAEHALGCMLALAKSICRGHDLTRRGGFTRRDELVGVELYGKTRGIVGFGRFGGVVARKCRAALGLRVLAFDPYRSAEEMEAHGVEKVGELGRLLAQADVISVHVPLTEQTRGLIGRPELGLVKRGAFLLNLSRGGVVDEGALVEALREGVVRGAAVDVFEEEPPPDDHPLFSLDNVVVTPHIAAHTEEAMRRMALEAAEAVVAFLEGRRPQHIVNPEALRDG